MFAIGDVVVVSGLPGSGKSTLIDRTVPGTDARGGPVWRLDSHDARKRWERRLPAWMPYTMYRPVVRLAHYGRLWRALRTGGSVVVHDCGSRARVRRWAAFHARRRGRGAHLVLVDVPAQAALTGQIARGRTVSSRAFARHCRAIGRLIAQVRDGRPPPGCSSAVLLDRQAAGALTVIGFG